MAQHRKLHPKTGEYYSLVDPKLPLEIPPGLTSLQLLNSHNHVDTAALVESYNRRFPGAFEALKICGVHPSERTDLLNPFEGSIDRRDFRNVGQHSVAVAYLTEKLLELIQPSIQLAESEKEKIIEAAMLHDVGKRFEVMHRQAYGMNLNRTGLSFHQELLKNGVAEEIAKIVANNGHQAGGENLDRFVSVDKETCVIFKETTLADKIVRLADDMTSTSLPDLQGNSLSIFVTFVERVVASNFKTRYPQYLSATVSVLEGSDRLIFHPALEALPNDYDFVGFLAKIEDLLADKIAADLLLLMKKHPLDNPQLQIKDEVLKSL